ncbi:hypothetical protein BS78_07G087200 [Paspalum vaginatum]|nr:hypothetical protein BS78_07G087200 [Paspalum vaginatum]
MDIRPLNFPGSQKSMKDDFSLHIGIKRKTTTGAILQNPNGQHETRGIHSTELSFPDYISWYVKDRLAGKITCMVCGEEGHYTCDCPMKKREEKVICILCNRVGHCHLWCCRNNVSENQACHRCGEKGHYTNKGLDGKYTKSNLSCSSCDVSHPLGKCPMGKITCFLCEGEDHVPAQCHLSPVLTVITQEHRESFRAAVERAMAKKKQENSYYR